MNKREIKLRLKNFKLHKDKTIIFSGSYIYFVQGQNDIGKTAVLQALAILMGEKENIDEIVTRGQKNGVIEGNIPGADKKEYLARYEFTNDGGKLTAVDPDGHVVSNVTDFRNIFKYTHITAMEMLNMSLNAKGIKEQKEFLLNFLTEKEANEYSKWIDIELVKYDARTDAKRLLETYKKQNTGLVLSDEDNETIKKEKGAKELIVKLREDLQKVSNLDTKKSSIVTAQENLTHRFTGITNDIKNILEKEDLVKQLNTLEKQLQDIYKEELSKLPELNKEELEDRIQKGTDLLEQITIIKGKEEMLSGIKEEMDKAQKSWEKLDKEITEAREKQKEIIKNSNIPIKNLVIEDDGITIDGFSFKENQICMSKAVEVIANIMCKINEAPIVLMGDAGGLDWNTLEKMNEIAKANGKIMIYDEVVRDKEKLVVVGYDELNVKTTSKEKKEEVTKKDTKDGKLF